MPRPRGSRNPDYEQKRRELIARLAERLVRLDGTHAGVRELAAACGVTLPTLRHYFGKREDILRAIFEQQRRDGARHLEYCATSSKPFAESIAEILTYTMNGLRYGPLSQMFAIGMTEGIRNRAIGPAWVETILEPTIDAFRRRLDLHVLRGEMRSCDTRSAAIALVSPLILASFHQRDLGGAAVHPLNMDAFVASHAGGFVRGFAADNPRTERSVTASDILARRPRKRMAARSTRSSPVKS